LSPAQDAAVVPIPGAQGLCRRRGGDCFGDAAGREGGETVVGALRSEPPDDHALARVVAQHFHGEPVLARDGGRIPAACR